MGVPADRLAAALAAGYEAFEEGAWGVASAQAAAAEQAWRDAGSVADPADGCEAALLSAQVAAAHGDDAAAFEHLREAAVRDPGASSVRLVEARLRMERWELERAGELLATCDVDELGAELIYERAVVAELRGEQGRADQLYRDAERADPEGFPAPVRMADGEALALLKELVAMLPADVRATLANVRIDLLDVPDAAIDGSPDTDPLVLGLYHGTPITDELDRGIGLPDTVRIFKRNIERLAADRGELVEQLRITLLHEIGHHLGWDEDEVADHGLA
ncbi:MAG: metallopeptidase family protein [Planctomycetota bacterium]